MTEKSASAYRTISEAGEEAGLPAHVLRFWESKFTQLKPVKRAGGRRLYRPQDVQLLKGLKRLLYEEGYTIKGAQKYLKDHGVAHVGGLADGEGGASAPDPAPLETRSAEAEPAETSRPGPSAHAASDLPHDAADRLRAVQERLRSARDSLRTVL